MINSSPGTDRLRFDRPAEQWTDALPLGNGLIGAMCFGEAGAERILLNHTTGWSGGPATERSGALPSADTCAAAIAGARQAVTDRDWTAVERALQTLQHGSPQSFLPVAELIMRLTVAGVDAEQPAQDYQRTLDLDTAVHTVSYRRGGTVVTTRTRASHPHRVLAISIDLEGAAGDLTIDLQSPLRYSRSGTDLLLRFPSYVEPGYHKSSEPVRYSDGDQEALDGAVAVRVRHDGDSTADGTGVVIGARHIEIFLAIETTFTRLGQPLSGDADTALRRAIDRAQTAARVGAATIARAQQADHRELYDRCRLSLGREVDDSCLDRRLSRAFDNGDGALAGDPRLAALLFGYGRYLLICSSRPGGLPANLQGIWNQQLQPPWSSDYTMNINLEMNYWLAEQTGLSECLDPLFDFIEALAASGAETAARIFGAPGWVAFHCSDAWGYSQPVGDGTDDPCWAFWPFAGAWLLQHLRDRLQFGGADDFARRAWPLVRSAAEFIEHFLIETADGHLGTSPSTSPENHFTAADGSRGAVAASSTMDIALARDTFGFLLELADRLGRDDDPVVAAARSTLPRLPRPVINNTGMISEWPDAELVPEPDHRHTAQLYVLHPGTEPLTPELIAAADAGLTARGEDSTGWALVWRAAMRARLRQPEPAGRLLGRLFRDATVERGRWAAGLYRNLFAAHPPFQIDANLGFVDAVAECLLQSHAGVIDLLPALPTVLGPGSVRGLIARPGISVDLGWRDGDLVAATLTSRAAGVITEPVRYRDRTISCRLEPGRPVQLTEESFAADTVVRTD